MSPRSFIAIAALLAAACSGDTMVSSSSLDGSATATPFFSKSFLAPGGGFQSPVRLALAPGGGLLVSDSRSGAIVGVDRASARPTTAMEVRGSPLAVGMLAPRIFVGNATTRRVEVYNTKGKYWYAFGTPVAYPTDLAVDSTRRLVFVVDAVQRDVKVFDVHGVLQRVMPSGGAAAGQLHVPTGIALDVERREVLVSDYPDPAVGGSAAVRIYDYEGRLLDVLSPGKCGFLGCTGGFSRPQGVAVDNGRIYLADALLAQVLVFDRGTLALVKTLGGRDAGPPQLRIPLDVAVGPGGDVFVTSNRTGSVEVFRNGALP